MNAEIIRVLEKEFPTPAPATKVFVVQAEHFNVPGIITHVHANRASAEDEAIELTNVMLVDNDDEPCAGRGNWPDEVERLQDEHGEAHCYVEIIETELRGN